MVVLLTIVHIVVYSLLVTVLFFLMPVGTVVLLYCSSYYPQRGGASNYSAFCGSFSVLGGNIISYTIWANGAALSFIIKINR